ncbi:MAG: ATP-binding cassette domain-containing protein [Actinomycetota bacterium]
MSLKLNSVSFAYRRDEPILADFSLAVEPGESVAVMGPSGSGKSTILGVAGLLLRPDHGSVRIGNEEVPVRGSRRRRIRSLDIAWIFQSLTVAGGRTVLDNAALGLLAHGETRCSAQERAMRALAAVEIEELSLAPVDELSGGQLQRVCIARALAVEPRVILADEPTGQLDRKTSDRVMDALLRAIDKSEAALLMATHDHRVAAGCSRIVSL